MVNALRNKITLSISKIKSDHFSTDTSLMKKWLFNSITILFFISIFLSMGFTRIFPLNILLKFSFLLTNLLILIYVVFFEKIRVGSYLLLILLSILWFAFVAIITKTIGPNSTIILNLSNMVPVYLILKSSEKMKSTFKKAMIFGLCLYTFSFTLFYYKELLAFDLNNRLGTFFGNQNDVAATLLISSTVFLYYFLNKKYLAIVPLLLSMLNLLSTGSRAGLLNLVVVSFMMLFFLYYKKHRKLLLLTIATFILLIAIVINTPPFEPIKSKFINLFTTLFTSQNPTDASIFNRSTVIFEAITLFLLSPIFGNSLLLPHFTFDVMVAHNAFLEIAAGQGLFALILFILLFIYPIIKLSKENNKEKFLYISLIIGSVLFHLTLTSTPFKEQYLILAFAASTLIRTRKIEIDLPLEFNKFVLRRKSSLHVADIDKKTNADTFLLSKGDLIIVDSKDNNFEISKNDFEKLGIPLNTLSSNSDIKIDTLSRDSIYLIDDMDPTDNSSLSFLRKLLKHTNYKVIVLGSIDMFNYKVLHNIKDTFLNFNHSIQQSTPIDNDVNKLDDFREDASKKSLLRGSIIKYLFLGLFNILTLASFSFSLQETIMWQKIVLIVFSVIYYFQVIRNLFVSTNEAKNVKLIIAKIIIVVILPISLFYLFVFLLPNMFKIGVVLLIFSGFVVITNLLSILVSKIKQRK